MIQIKIIHHTDETTTVDEIIEQGDNPVRLAKFDKEKGFIDFSVIKDRIGEEIIIDHYNEDSFDYSCKKVLHKVGKDEHGIDFISYN